MERCAPLLSVLDTEQLQREGLPAGIRGPLLSEWGWRVDFQSLKRPEDVPSVLVNAGQSFRADERHSQEVDAPETFQEWPLEQMSWASL